MARHQPVGLSALQRFSSSAGQGEGDPEMGMRDFRQLKVWEKSHRLALAVYESSRTFPSDETYGLASQLRRAAASIPANIAEGCGCETDVEFRRFLQIAMRSASELEYHLLLAHDLGYLTYDDHLFLSGEVVEVKKMLSTFIVRIRATG